jgi:hypothetical protein
VNRKLLLVVAVAAVLALLAGAAVGRNLLSSAQPQTPHADVVRFDDDLTKVSIDYPSAWKRLALPAKEPDVALLVASPDDAASLRIRAAAVGIDNVTRKTLPILRKFTDGLLATDSRITQLVAPVPVDLGGLLGYRYRYTFGSGGTGGAHDHYFLFKDGALIQLVFQAVPATRLPNFAPEFDSIARTFKGNDG